MPSFPLFLSSFGALGLRWNGKDIAIAGEKPAALLAYLALEPGPHRRESLAELLWPGVPTESARHSLRQTVFNLRNLLMDATGHAFIAGRNQLAWDGESVFTSDVALLLDAVAGDPGAPMDDATRITTLKAAMAVYAGPFLSTLSLADCQDFMDWVHFKREALHLRALELLRRLIDCLESQGRTREALSFALRYTELEPWSEMGYLHAMRLYAADGQRDAALALYETYCRVLERDLGVLPGKDVQALMEDLRHQNRTSAELVSRLEERRQVTVLFCELHVVNVSDPEEAMERLVTPQALCEEMVHAQGGHMVQAHGGGLLAYFGYPLALEHSAICGLRAARRMAVLTAPGLEVRVGVHQGFIVTGGDPNLPDPIGMTSNVAIQLRALAEVGEVLASGEVCRSAATYFAFVPVGQRRLRRMAGAVEVFQVGDESGVRHRLEAATKLTPLVGREAELRVLEQAWGQAHGGKFAALLISGEPGMGKSRLVREWTDRVANGENTVYELRCFSETRHSPWHPVIEAYQTMAGICAADGPEVKLDKLHALFRRRVPTLANRALPLLARLLDVPMEGVASSAEPLDKELPRLLVDLLLAIAARNPVLFVLEDAHWADESTLAFLSQLCSRTKDAAICLLVTTRPEFQPDWPNLDQLALSPLDDAAVCAIVRAVCGDMPTASMENIVARADGIPLYAEELAALAQEEDLPSNLLDLLTARLDALGGARAVAQLSACVGREIDEDFLGMISDMPASARRDAITRLLSSGLMQRLEDRRLQFKHTLVQEAAYKSQTKAARSAAHRRIAQVLEDGYGDLKTQQPEILARHWSAAGETKIAMGHWLAAGRHAAWNYAFPEAANHYTEGLALLPKLAQGADRDKLEFSLLINLARVEQMLSGYGHDRVMATMERALALLEMGVGDGIDRFHALWGLWEAAGSKQGHEEALRIARQMQTLAENENDRALWQQALYAVGNSLFWTGNLPLARSELERLIALENASDDGAVRDFYGRNVLSAARGYLAWILWLQGDTAQALTLCDEVLSLTKRLGVPFDQAFAYVFAVVLQRWQGNTEAVARLAEEGLCRAMACQSLPLMVAMKVHQAWTVVMDGDASALAPIEQAINAGIQSLSGGAMIVLPPFVDMLLAVGEVDKAQSIIEKALQHSQQKQDRHYLPELHRLQGECLVRQGDNKTARASFETAIKVGQKQGAMAFVRRAEQSLGRLMSG